MREAGTAGTAGGLGRTWWTAAPGPPPRCPVPMSMPSTGTTLAMRSRAMLARHSAERGGGCPAATPRPAGPGAGDGCGIPRAGAAGVWRHEKKSRKSTLGVSPVCGHWVSGTRIDSGFTCEGWCRVRDAWPATSRARPFLPEKEQTPCECVVREQGGSFFGNAPGLFPCRSCKEDLTPALIAWAWLVPFFLHPHISTSAM